MRCARDSRTKLMPPLQTYAPKNVCDIEPLLPTKQTIAPLFDILPRKQPENIKTSFEKREEEGREKKNTSPLNRDTDKERR